MKNVLFLSLLVFLFVSCNDVKKADALREENKFEEAFELYKKAADNGDAYAQWRVANAFLSGDGIEVDTIQYKEYLEKAAKGGCTEAIYERATEIFFGRYGFKKNEADAKKIISDLVTKTDNAFVLSNYAMVLLSENGKIFDQDKDKALSILNKIDDIEDPQYNYAMGGVYFFGAGDIEINYKKAIEYFEKAYKKGHKNSARILGSLYFNGNDEIEKDVPKSIEWFKNGSDRNLTLCMNSLAHIYLSEDSALQKFHNPQKGVELIKKAMKHLDGDAYANMGWLYQEGKYMEKDDQKALELYKKATDLSSSGGAFQLGQCYIEGIGCEKNYEKAVKAWEKAVELGNGSAANNLFCYYYGTAYDKKKKDKEKAKKYLIKGAELGDSYAQRNLAWFYFNGSDILKKNDNQGFIYAKLAADQGQADAIEMVANCYERGIGTNRDPKKAEEYRNKLKSVKK